MGLRRVLSRRGRAPKASNSNTNSETSTSDASTDKLLRENSTLSDKSTEPSEVEIERQRARRSPRIIHSLLQFLRFRDNGPRSERSWSDAATQDSISPLRLSEESDRDISVHQPLLQRRSSSLSFKQPTKPLKPSRSLFFRSPSTKSTENKKVRQIVSIPSLRRTFSQDLKGTVVRRPKRTAEPVHRCASPQYATVLSTVPEEMYEDDIYTDSFESLELPVLTEVASLKTVELSTAAQIYFTSHFARLTSSPSPRTLRRRTVEQAMKAVENEHERAAIHEAWLRSETERLRMSRSKKPSVGDYEVVKVIGKGAFGVVKLVRGKVDLSEEFTGRKPLYAMKIIKKTEMILNRQEGHLRAERDFLVASEGCRWIVPLVTSFQDKENLYLITEYCVGGDFLGLLLTQNVLSEEIARFYVAEMVLCIEEAHSLLYIHRDIKPDNFIFTSSGHLKLCDFGLAFSGLSHHSTANFQECSQGLMRALGLESGDWSPPTPLSNATNGSLRAQTRTPRTRMAKSVVGTVQYMAPEILRGDFYDGRCDWWSLGIILFEILYGFTPFQVDDSQYETRHRIENWPQYLCFPQSDNISDAAKSLVLGLLTERYMRLSASFYEQNDYPACPTPLFVHPTDAQAIKSHPFFHNINFSTLHIASPPFVPKLDSEEDTKYFEDSNGKVPGSESTGSMRRAVAPAGPAEELAVELRKECAFWGYTYRRPRSAVQGVENVWGERI